MFKCTTRLVAIFFSTLFSLALVFGQDIMAADGINSPESLKINCGLTSDEAQAQCKTLIADKLAGIGCEVGAVDCLRDTSNGRFKCTVASSNCESAKSDGFAGTSCRKGANEVINFGKKAVRLDPGFTAGLFKRAPQEICVTESQAQKANQGKPVLK
jgi:hypothetical protein